MPNAKVQETVCPAQSCVEEEFGTSNDVASHGGWGPRTTAAAALTASLTIKTEGWFASHVSQHKDGIYHGRSSENLQGQPADHHSLLRQRFAQGFSRSGQSVSPHS